MVNNMGNSIIEAQFEFFHDRTISEPEPLYRSFVSSADLLSGLFPSNKTIDRYPIDKMYEYKLPDIVITFADEVYRLATTLSEAEAKKAISELDQDDYPIYIRQFNPYSARHQVESQRSPHERGFLGFLADNMASWEDRESTTIRWHEQSFIKKEEE